MSHFIGEHILHFDWLIFAYLFLSDSFDLDL